MSKQLLQQALDYVENVPDDRCWGDYRDHQALEDALRAAISAPEPEPVAWARLRADGRAPDVVWQETAPDESYELALYCEPPDTEALRKELERVKEEQRLLHRAWFGHRDTGHLTFTEAVEKTMGDLYDELERVKRERDAWHAEFKAAYKRGVEGANCCPGSPGWPVALRDSTIDTITDACFQAVADQGTTVLMRAVARAVERQHGIAAQGEAKE